MINDDESMQYEVPIREEAGDSSHEEVKSAVCYFTIKDRLQTSEYKTDIPDILQNVII